LAFCAKRFCAARCTRIFPSALLETSKATPSRFGFGYFDENPTSVTSSLPLDIMSFNQIIKKTVTGTIVKNGKQYVLSVATHTDHWVRPECIVQDIGDRFYKAVDAWDGSLPENTAEICARCVHN
jgi:hypothetical protein